MVAQEAHEGVAAANWFVQHAWLIAFLPFVSATLTLFIGKRTPGRGAVYGIAAVGAGFVLSLGVLAQFVQHGGGTFEESVTWFQIGELHMEAGQLVDGLTAVMLVVVTSVSLCVHVYSLGYMEGDSRFTWFYVVLSLFTGAMLVVVIANNLFQLLVGWEIMGVCSYLLIGHWWEDHENSSAAIKAFITTRIGDVPFMFGIFALIFAAGLETSNILEIGEIIEGGGASKGLVTAAALLLFGGTIGKSAQFPLHVWLPDAMAGPTPVSALIHAATMVAAGVYLVGRLFLVFLHADPFVLQVVGIVGGITMFGAALLALVQDDIKRVLAYSTVSQLAYMVSLMSIGEAGRNAAFFHLFTHAFFKGLLFLAAGSLIHAVHSNNMSDMGGLRKPMPVTFWTFVIGAGALAGLPPLAGFWSKDELLVAASHGHEVVFTLVLVTAVVTAFYTARMVMLTFSGEYRGHAHPHESPPSMTGPLVALAGATLVVGFLGAAQTGAPFFDWVFLEHPEADRVRARRRRRLGGSGAPRGRGGRARLPAPTGAGPDARDGTGYEAPAEQVLHGLLLLEGHRAAGARQPVGRRLLDEPEGPRRRRERRGAADEGIREGRELVRSEGDRRGRERGREHRRVHRRHLALHPVGQRPALRRVPVHRRHRAGRHLHEDLRGDESR